MNVNLTDEEMDSLLNGDVPPTLKGRIERERIEKEPPNCELVITIRWAPSDRCLYDEYGELTFTKDSKRIRTDAEALRAAAVADMEREGEGILGLIRDWGFLEDDEGISWTVEERSK